MATQVPNVENIELQKVKWNEKLVGVFLRICVEEINAGNRPTTHFNKKGWANIIEKVNVSSGRSFGRKQLKNKWDLLKKEWQIWWNLIKDETGLGWDPQLKTVQQTDDWWQKKEKNVPGSSKFKDQGLPFLEEMEICFKDVVATGDRAWAPSSGVLPSSSSVGKCGGEYNDVNLNETHEESLETGRESAIREDETEGHDDDAQTLERGKKRKKTKSFNGKEKRGAASKVTDQLNRICNAMESRNSVSVKEVMSIIQTFPEFVVGSDFFYIATRLMTKKSNREMFMALQRDAQLGWLKSFNKEDL